MATANNIRLRAAVSPCPNDTFIVHGLVSKLLTVPGADIDWTFEDVETLNRAAFHKTFDLTKLSFHAYLLVKDEYALLRAGAALGFGCGPIAVSRSPIRSADLPSLRIVIPGELTTAHLLFRLYCPQATNKRFVRYDEIMPSVQSGEAEVGVIIHEDRFVYEKAGLFRVVDLGQWWEKETGAPLPLGCLALRKHLAPRFQAPLTSQIQNSIRRAGADFDSALPFIRSHAKQMDKEVLRLHINTFVNDFTIDLGPLGDRAVNALEKRAAAAGIIP